MSIDEYFEDEITQPKNGLVMSDLNINEENFFQILNEGEQNEKANLIEINYLNNSKENYFNKKNVTSDELKSLDSFIPLVDITTPIEYQNSQNSDKVNYETPTKLEQINNQNYFDNIDYDIQSDFPIITENKEYSFSGEKYNNSSKTKKEIFKVINDWKTKTSQEYANKKRHRSRSRKKKEDIDWDNMYVPKEKHFHLDRKKKRIIFQRKHLKMIYSIVDLEYPFDFNFLFRLIDNHVGNKTLSNYRGGKSFHIVKVDGKFKIITMKEKKILKHRYRDD